MYESITAESIKAKILEDAKAEGVSVDTGSYINLLASPIAYEMWNDVQKLNTFMEALCMDTAPEEYALLRCRDFGIERKEAEKSVGILKFTGDEGAAVPRGTVCKTSDGRRYITTGECTIEGGAGYAEAESENAGKEYNASAGEIKHFDAAPDGILSVVNESAFSGGSGAEDIESMKERFYQKVRYSPASGNAEDYRKWSMEISEVYSARVEPLYNGPGTVKVILVGEGNSVVSDEVVRRAEEHIESVRPVGAAVKVISCRAAGISIRAKVILKYEATLSDIISTVKSSVEKYFADFEGEYVYLSKIMQLIMDTDNVWSVTEILLNGAADDIMISSEQVPKLLEFNIEEAV